MADYNKAKDFTGINAVTDFGGYFSSYDKTKITTNVLVGGSKNVYKKINGNIGVRDGLKRRGTANSTISPVSSSYIYRSSWGDAFPIWVSNNKVQVELTSGTTYTWYDIFSTTETRWVFDAWWDNTLKKNKVIACNGTSTLYSWAGGVTQLSSATASTITKTGTATWTQDHFETTSLSTVGSSTTQFDITNPSGTTFRYTFDGTGTDPGITSTTAPIGSYVYINAQNFTTANNGLFVITGSGTNYFEITNASGVAENNKTIGTGAIYINFKNLIVIGGTTYGYTGGQDTTTLTGVTPDPSAIVANTYVFSGLIPYQNKPAESYSADFLRSVNNRVFVGSYTSQLVYVSSSTDFTNYTIPASIIPGSPNILTLDGVAKGIGVRQGNAHVSFGTDGWVEVTFPTYSDNSGIIYEQITPVLKPVQALGAAYAHEFIGNNGDSFYYLAQDQQLRYFGDSNNSFSTVYPCLSQEIYSEIQTENFTNGALKVIADRTYITAPATGNVWIYQVRQSIQADNSTGSERIWYSPFVLNSTRIDEIGGEVVAFSNSNPQVYYVWGTEQWHDDSPSDEYLPYTCIVAFPYNSITSERQRMLDFRKLYTEGYLATGTQLYAQINYDYLGSNAQLTAPVNTNTRPATIFRSNVPSLGDNILGESPIGDILGTDDANYPKFRSINEFALTNCFEYQKIYYSDTADSRWEILATGTDAKMVTVDPVQIINKAR